MTKHAKPRIALPIPTAQDSDYNQRSWIQYAAAVKDAGGEPVEIPLTSSAAALEELLQSCDGVCLPGSPADVDPARFGAEPDPACAPPDQVREAMDFRLLDVASAEHKPLLGICFGLQSMNVWAGGTLVQDLHALPVNHSAGRSVAVAHTALIAPESTLGRLLDPTESPLHAGLRRLPVNSSHHQAVGTPGDGLRITARCPEDGVIEALEQDESWAERRDRPSWMVGVQWHPERSTGTSAASRALFGQLIQQASLVQGRR